MKDVVSIRRENLQALVDQFGLTSVAKRMKRSPTQINDMLAERKSFGEKVARAMEKEWDATLPVGWLSVEKTAKDGEDMRKSNVVELKQKPVPDIVLQQFDTGGAMGHGIELRDQPGIIQSWRVNPEWLDRNVRAHSSAKNLCIVTGFGDSMQPLFNPGDPLLVDIGVKSVDFDSVYFFRIGNDGYVKRLQRIPTESGLVIRARSENKEAYDPFDITESMDFEVLGRVLKVWRSQDF
ncbi:helix-turn-helix transcriptional regulator [Alcaligenaceae bacterium]|nr:helix-turn-helix transcriptional regulator [Alcaligenaceae bacterium]